MKILVFLFEGQNIYYELNIKLKIMDNRLDMSDFDQYAAGDISLLY